MYDSLTSISISSDAMSTIVPMPVRVKPPPADTGEIISPGCDISADEKNIKIVFPHCPNLIRRIPGDQPLQWSRGWPVVSLRMWESWPSTCRSPLTHSFTCGPHG